jgi:hypothetical protein
MLLGSNRLMNHVQRRQHIALLGERFHGLSDLAHQVGALTAQGNEGEGIRHA